MSFKLLAIRPLEGTDPKFLKNLRPNCIYKFYNDYHYLDEHGNKLDEYKDDQEFIDFIEVINITKNETVPQNLYGDNINISALVGKNGSGKSTLLELFYMCILSIEKGGNIHEFLYLEIYFEIDNLIHKLKIERKFDYTDTDIPISLGLNYINFIYEGKEFILKEKLSEIFFTNVINYSIYGFNENISGEWLGEIFRKNDAYTTPITINPHRVNGNIDVNKEHLLAQQRMILNHYVIGNKNILEGYKLEDIVYTLNVDKTQKIFYENKGIEKNIYSINYILNLCNILYGHTNNGIDKFVHLIFKSFNINNDELKNLIINKLKNRTENNFVKLLNKININKEKISNEFNVLTFIYLIKIIYTISINSNKYEKYQYILKLALFENDINENSKDNFYEKNENTSLELFKSLLNELNENRDHTTFEIKQILKYFENRIIDNLSFLKGNVIKEILKINLGNYINDDTKIEDIPLAMFDHEIIIDKKGKKIDFKNLSSGEQQKIHTILNVVYHAYNITSKNEDERYKNMNLIFDEVELYFHPEFQRTFISDLLAALKFFDGKLNFNILFSTHSPFILSDIPSQNILKLEDGKPQPDKDEKNSFGANIHDLLADEFFLENGTMGAFANKKIKEIIDFLKDDKSNNFEKDYVKHVIDLVGEPLLRNSLLNLYRIKYREKTYEELLKFYEDNAANQ